MHSKRNKAWITWGIFLGVAAALGALLWAGWSLINHRPLLPGSASSNSTVTIGITDMPQSLDIRSNESAAAERLLIDNVYETLVSVDQDNQLQPGLARQWKASDDGLTYTLTMKSGVTFSNGHTLDASDAVWSLQQSVTNTVAGVDALGQLASVTNPNATTVVITLSQPNPTLLRALSGRLGIVYDSEANGTDYERQSAGSGPFTVGDFQPGKSLTFTRNDAYHGTKAASGTIDFAQYADGGTLAKALTDGTIDMAAPASPTVAASMAEAVKKSGSTQDGSKLNVAEGATTDKMLLAFNHSADSLLSDEQARKAFRYLIDAASIASSQPDSGGALGGPISPLEPGYEDLTELYPHDVAKAQEMLGYFDPQYKATVNLVVSEQYRSLAENITQQIGQLSLPAVNLEVLSDADYAKRIQAGTWELTIMSMNGTDDAGVFADSDSVFHYDRAEAQEDYSEAQAATNDEDYAKRMATYARALSEDAASDWLYTRKCFVAADAKLSGYPTAMVDQHLPLANVVMQRA
jgi:ABC-type transport system substrate-binding protein